MKGGRRSRHSTEIGTLVIQPLTEIFEHMFKTLRQAEISSDFLES